jgi:hypothetical protein
MVKQVYGRILATWQKTGKNASYHAEPSHQRRRPVRTEFDLAHPDQLSTSMTRLSTGYRINSAMDDAAGLQIATRLKAQTSGMAVAMRNTQNSTSMLQTAEGALDEVSNMLVRMKDLATQAPTSRRPRTTRTPCSWNTTTRPTNWATCFRTPPSAAPSC